MIFCDFFWCGGGLEMESTPSKTAKSEKQKKIEKIGKNVFCSKFCVLSTGKVSGRFVRNVLVTFYTEIGRGPLKMEKNVEMCKKSKKSFLLRILSSFRKNSFVQFGDIFLVVEFERLCPRPSRNEEKGKTVCIMGM